MHLQQGAKTSLGAAFLCYQRRAFIGQLCHYTYWVCRPANYFRKQSPPSPNISNDLGYIPFPLVWNGL